MTELAHIHRTVDGVAEIDVVGDGLFGGRTAVTVAGVHQLIVVGAVVQHPEKAVPVGTAQQDDVVFIYLSDGLYRLFIYRLQQLVERVLVGKIVSDGLVHQFVAQNGGLAAIAIGYLAPDIAELLLALLTFEQPGVTVSVVDVIARLSAWTVVHIQNQIQVVGLAPGGVEFYSNNLHIPVNGQSYRRIYSISLQTGNSLFACYICNESYPGAYRRNRCAVCS